MAPKMDAGGAMTYRLPGVGYVEGGAQFYERENAQGSTVSTVDASGATVSRAFYDAYGVESMVQPGARSRHGYAGKHGYAADGASGMLLCGARFYVPALGRFLTPDPIGHEGGLNLYAYCENNPVARIDPDGTQGFTMPTGDLMAGIINLWRDGGLWRLAPDNRSWREAQAVTMMFEDGIGPTRYVHKGLQNPRVVAVAYSGIGTSVYARVLASTERELRAGIKGWVTSDQAFLNTLGDFGNGTQAQLGAVEWRARLVGKDLNVVVSNKIGVNSLFYHAPSKIGIPDHKRRFGGDRYGDVKQFFPWKWRIRR